MTPDGLIAHASKFGPKETMNRLAAAVTIRGKVEVLRRTAQHHRINWPRHLPRPDVVRLGEPVASVSVSLVYSGRLRRGLVLRNRRFADSPLEGTGFEPSVPLL